jgi:antirestriction protein ArdC
MKQSQKQELCAKLKQTVEMLANETDAARQSELFRDYLRCASLFHNYSWGNQMMIWTQRPTATRVAGYHTWQKMGRYVKQGQKGIAIFAPMVFKKQEAADADGLVTVEKQQLWFKVVFVFDLAQTDGQPLPDLPTGCAGDAGDLELRLCAFAAEKGILVENGDTGDAKGYAEQKGTHIVLSRALEAAERAAVLVHELAHCLLHFGESHRPNLRQRELEAEATAYTVAHHFGLSVQSNFYLASYGVKASDLLESLPIIQQTAHQIIDAVEPWEQAAAQPESTVEQVAA